jgi:tetratricopeptide (TPR) repeat protein
VQRGEDGRCAFAHLTMREAVARRYFNFVPAHPNVGEIEMEEGLATLNLQASVGLRQGLLEKGLVLGKEATFLHFVAGRHLFGLAVEDPLRQSELMHHSLHGQHKLPFGGLIISPEVYYASITDEMERRQATRTLAEFAGGDHAAPDGYNEAVLERVLRMLRVKDFQTRLRVAQLFDAELIPELDRVLEGPRREAVIRAVLDASREALDSLAGGEDQILRMLFSTRPFDELAAAAPLDEAQAALARGNRFRAEGDTARALRHSEQAIRSLEADPGDASEGRMLIHAIAFAQVGHCLTAEGRSQEAVTAFRRYTSLLEQKHAAFPKSERGRRDMAIGFAVLGEALARANQTEEAKACLVRAAGLLDEGAATPADPGLRRDLRMACLRTGRLLLNFGARAEAARCLGRFLGLADGLLARDPEDAGLVTDMAWSRQQLGEIALTAGQAAQAVEQYRAAVRLWESALELRPDDRAVAEGLSIALSVLIRLTSAVGDAAGTLALCDRRLRLLEGLLAACPNDPAALRALAFTHKRLGELAHDRGDGAAAVAEYLRYRDGLAACARAAPEDRMAACDAGLATYFVADLFLAVNEPARAWPLYQEAAAAFFTLAGTHPGLPGDVSLLLNITEALGRIAAFAQGGGLDSYAESCLGLAHAIRKGLG